ncbi:hypothetical protein BH11PLA1_BH11PLA1_23810 [soil metagenome]
MTHGHAAHPGSHGPLDESGARVVNVVTAGAMDSAGHHGHHIVPRRVLLTVLAILMFFTFATVGAAWTEEWISHAFHLVIPQWVNVAVALSIAVIKSVVVAMFFMQLKYDNPVNSLVVVFTLSCVAFFLGFTMLDLGNRGIIYDYKGKLVNPGGTGAYLRTDAAGNQYHTAPDFGPVQEARRIADLKIDSVLGDALAARDMMRRDLLNPVLQTRFATRAAAALEEGKPLPDALAAYLRANPELLHLAHGHSEEGVAVYRVSSAQASRPNATLGLPMAAGAMGGHGGEHDESGPARGGQEGEHGANAPHDQTSSPAATPSERKDKTGH